MGSPPRPHSACLPSQHNDVVLSLVAYNKACFFEGGGGGGGAQREELKLLFDTYMWSYINNIIIII